jgi:chorismate-pyruvate lyase
MELHPLFVDRPPLPVTPVDAGWARSIRQGPRTIGEVLRSASEAMDREDEAERYRADPIAYISAHQRKHRLWDRLFGRR